MKKKVIIVLAFILLAVAAILVAVLYRRIGQVSPTDQEINQEVFIGFSMSTQKEERWQRDRDEFIKQTEKLGVSLDLQSANNDVDVQIKQIRSMIYKGVDVLVIAPQDAESLTAVIDEAHQAGIKVISYDRLIRNADVDLYISFDNEIVGEYQADYVIKALSPLLDTGRTAKVAYIGGAETDNNSILLRNGSYNILQPLISQGKIQIVLDEFTDKWDPENAYANIKDYLEDGYKLDAVIAANDGTAFGVITALKEYGLAGKVPVSGQDAELSALRSIVEGTQTVTVYKPIKNLADTAVEVAIKMALGREIEINSAIDNGAGEIPAILLESIPVTAANIQETVIQDGYVKAEDIYK